jgi:hypothetical protein
LAEAPALAPFAQEIADRLCGVHHGWRLALGSVDPAGRHNVRDAC